MTGSSQRFSCQVVFHDPVASLESTLHCHIKHKRILHMLSYIFCVVNVECSTVQRNGNLFAPMLWYIYFAFTHHTRTWHTSLRPPEYLRITACSPYKCFFAAGAFTNNLVWQTDFETNTNGEKNIWLVNQ